MQLDDLTSTSQIAGRPIGTSDMTVAAAVAELTRHAATAKPPGDYDRTASNTDGEVVLHSMRIRDDGEWHTAGDMVAPGATCDPERMYPAGHSHNPPHYGLTLALGFTEDHRERSCNAQYATAHGIG